MLKFRLPWGDGESEYLNGKIMLPVWGPQTTTEARLVITSIEYRKYDNLKYGDQMFYFNSITRVQFYDHDIVGRGIDHCYDCAAEICILRRYLSCHFKLKNMCDVNLSDAISAMSEEISRNISPRSKRTLEMKTKVHAQFKWFPARQYNMNEECLIYLGESKWAPRENGEMHLKPRSLKRRNESPMVPTLEPNKEPRWDSTGTEDNQ